MRKLIANRAANISPSLTLSITAKAKKMREEGASVIGFGAGEPDFNTPAYIIEAAKKALDKGYTKYTESSGILPLKRAICDKLKRDNSLIYDPKQIIVSNGAKHSLFNAIFALIEEGDEVIIPSPYWLTYPELVKLAGGVPRFVKTDSENSFKMTPKQLREAVTDRTKLVIINSPSNPTGSVYTRGELEALGEVIIKKDLFVISDEVYEKLIYEGKHVSIASLSDELYRRTVVVNGLSKSYSMTGWRMGYLAAAREIVAAIDAIQSHATSNINTMTQYASVEALTNPQGEQFLSEMLKTFDERRRYMVGRIKSIKGLNCCEPCGAFYVMMDVSKLKGKAFRGRQMDGSVAIAECLLDYGVAAVPGIAFGADDYLRLSCAISLDDIKEGLGRIERFAREVLG
ncbi:MAG: pyridoxal phosphate-dependent aminotransferase [Clostridiales bacterium]|jgi:aspartate aminotransferase|nr:pyridoxal phosphate-dependent aminotransferase [Clostridiales bacterium]